MPLACPTVVTPVCVTVGPAHSIHKYLKISSGYVSHMIHMYKWNSRDHKPLGSSLIFRTLKGSENESSGKHCPGQSLCLPHPTGRRWGHCQPALELCEL